MDKDNDTNYSYKGTGLSSIEKRWAGKRYKEYQDNYYINSFSDRQLLEELVFFEALQERYKKTAEKILKAEETASDGKKKDGVIPSYLAKGMTENLKQIIDLKERLGLLNKEETDELKTEVQRKKKFKKWLAENQAVRETKCPHCSRMILLRIRADKYDATRHPYFMDRYFFNKPLWRLYLGGVIDRLQLAKSLLGEQTTLTDYLDWIEKELENNPEFKKLKQEFGK